MRKICLCSFLVVPFLGTGQTEFSIFAGPQITTANYTIQTVKQKTEHKYGFMAGVGWKIPFENKLSFAPEIFYSQKGYKVSFNQFTFPPGEEAKDNNTNIHTLEFAGLLQFDLGKLPSHFFLKAGLSLDFQIYGREKFNTLSGTMIDRKMKYNFGEYGRYSANAIIQFGYETAGGFFLAGRYTNGLANINNADEGPNIHHMVYGLVLGIYLKRNKIVIDTRNKE